MNGKRIVLGALKLAGAFYVWGFRNIFRLIKKSDQQLAVIEEKKRRRKMRDELVH